MTKLSQSTIEKLGYYVYLLIDPRNSKPFYVGKGYGERINHHLVGALEENVQETEKIRTIKVIQNNKQEVGLVILRHGLTEKEAYEVESTLIDYIGMENLTNLAQGHHSFDRGKMSLSDIEIKYQAQEASFEEPVLLVNLNKRFKPVMSSEEIYQATKGNWIVSKQRVKDIRYVCAVYRGIIREIFTAHRWMSSDEKGRLCFEGEVAPEEVRNRYVNKSASSYWNQGSQNPIKYVDV